MLTNIFLYTLLGAISIQIVYLIVFFSKLYGYKPRPRSESTPPVSVIIAARNEEQNLKRLLPKLYAQDYPNFEIIVVNDRSSDGTYDFLMGESSKNTSLKQVNISHTPEHMSAKKFALTLGIKAAAHDLLILTDADCYPNNSNWVSSMAAGFADDKQIVLGVSQYNRHKGLLNAFTRYETMLTAIQYISFALMGQPYMGVGRNLAYRKQLFMDNKGFFSHQKVIGGDDDLFVNQHATKPNTNVVIGADAMVYSSPKRSWKQFFKQKKRHLSVGKYYRRKDKIILGLFSLTHLITWMALPVLMTQPRELYWAVGGFGLRMVLFFMAYTVASKKFGSKFMTYSLPVLDFIYVFYYITTGIAAFFSKRIKWS